MNHREVTIKNSGIWAIVFMLFWLILVVATAGHNITDAIKEKPVIEFRCAKFATSTDCYQVR